MLRSFRSPLVVSNLLITLAGLLIVAGVFVRLLADRSIEIKRNELAKQSRAVAGQIDQLFVLHSSDQALTNVVANASRLLGERIIVVGHDGRHIVDSAATTPYVTGSWHPIDVQALQRGKVSSTLHQNLLLFQTPLHSARTRKVIGAVQLEAQVTEVNPDTASLVEFALVAVGTALLVWLLMGLYFTFWVFRPLLHITEATARMAQGDYDVRVDAGGPAEIGRLARSFNSMARQVQQSNQVLKDFVANVSHDLRTPLTMIAGYSQALLDGTAGSEDVKPAASVISEESAKMEMLVDDLLQLTRLEAGLLSLDRHPTAVRPFLEAVVERTVRMGPDRTGRVRVTAPARLPAIDVDPDRFERAVHNLVENALEYGGPDGIVTVGAGLAGDDEVAIWVTDTGPGIAPEELPRVFERFYRSDRGRDRAHGHSGLGLAIVREIVEAHGGRVSATSEIGKGTTFRLTVPASTQPAPDHVEHPSVQHVGEPATR